MQIRRNTKSFKTILEIVTTTYSRPDRQDLIRLSITKLGHSIKQRIPVHGSQSEAEFFYDLNFQAVMNNLKSSGHQLYQSDDEPGVYFFRGNLGQDWDQTPFEFDEKIKKEFASLPELPLTREKGKAQEFVLPDPNVTEEKQPKKLKKEPAPVKAFMTVSRNEQPPPPKYNLKRDVHFTELDKVVFRNAGLSKKNILDYYDKTADYIIPYLKDRPLQVRIQSDGGPKPHYNNIESLPKKGFQEIPGWVQSTELPDAPALLCNDKEHLMLYAELGVVEFAPCLSRRKTPDFPDHCVIRVDSGSEFSKAVDVALTTREILEGLELPSFIKADGVSGLHICIPLDSKSNFETSKSFGESICKLIRLKLPNMVTINGIDEFSYGLVTLDAQVNSKGYGIVAPYSFVAGSSALIATPLEWDELDDELRADQFTQEFVLSRFKSKGDLFEGLSKKGVNASELVETMAGHYGFLW